MNTDLTKIYDSLSSCLKTNIYAIVLATYIIVIFLFMTNNPDVLFSTQYFYLSIIMIPLFVFGAWFIKNNGQERSFSQFEITGLSVGTILLLVGMYLYISKDISIMEIYSSAYIIQSLTVLIVLVALAIGYKTLIQKLYITEGWSGFFIRLLFFIPCLISDFIEFILSEFNATSNVVFTLFIIEILLVLFYFYLPKLMKASIDKNGTVLVKDPVPINMKKPLKTYVDLNNTSTMSDLIKINKPLIIRNKFALSAWVYIVSQPSSKYPYNDEATIFEFTTLHPKLVYNGKNNKFKAYFNQADHYEFDMPLQKWNYVVFNYDTNNIDLFINGKLDTSIKRNVNNDNFKINDLIYIGQERGLAGGICNFVYSDAPLLGEDIKYNYNYNKYNEPPV
jgi:hypothetical protein